MSETRQPYRVAVYCASAMGNDPTYGVAASTLGRSLAEAGMGLIYGGASVGLMGTVADAALAAGGEVIGVLPEILKMREVAHAGLSQLILTRSMHERKARMIELSDAMIALPGGFGTLDEMMEALTWAQLGIHASPCLLINTLGYYDGLLQFLDTAVDQGFLQAVNRRRIQVVETPEEAVRYLKERRK